MKESRFNFNSEAVCSWRRAWCHWPLNALVVLAGVAGALAQEPQFRQLQQTPATSAPSLTSPTAMPLSRTAQPEEDEEIGQQFLLRRKVAQPQFSIIGDAQYYYTDNALLESAGKHDDMVFVGTTGASWNPTWIKDVTGSVYVRQQFFRYNENSAIDFDATTAGFYAGSKVKDWFNISGGYSVTRLETRATDDEFYKEGDANLTLSRTQMIGRRVAIPYGYTFDFYHASPDSFTRATHGFFVGVNCALTQKLLGQFFYRFQYEDYQETARGDQASIFSASLTYAITPWASVRTFMSWTLNDSSIRRDYEVLNGGAGLNLVVRF